MRSLTRVIRLLLLMTLSIGAQVANSQRPTKIGPSQEAITVTRPVAPFTVGIGDVLNILVWNEKELSPNVTVRPDGVISMPLIGELTVVGMTPAEIQALLQKRLQTIVVDPRVTVTVAEIHSRVVYIVGEIVRPGAYPINGSLDVLQLIAQAGGLTQFASKKRLRIVAANGSSQNILFDYKKMLHGKEGVEKIPLSPGDTVVVP